MSGLPRLVASLGGIGFLKPAPGTWGSAAVLPLVLGGPVLCLAAAAALLAAGLWAVSRLREKDADPPWVVVDEAAGQLIALAGISHEPSPVQVAVAFVVFRGLDVTKPGPVGWADRQPGAWGVMLDDVVAGGLAAAALLALGAAGFPWGL
ncbi:MAG: phosphatidylglycerophosphatase A [Acetobacteraceae bacterium]|nr:phosphatidylglycerophosphatase A [Acetobacteraceae bacterium]